MGWIILLSIFVFLILNIPIAFSIGMASVVAILIRDPYILEAAPHIIFAGLNSFPLMAIPLFVLAGELMNTGGITQQLVDFAKSLIGHLKGGLAFVTIVASMVMAGVSGSAVADTAALATILIPAMVLSGISRGYASALVAVAGTIGIIIPPSIPMILYGVTVNVSIGALFLGGTIPGIIVGVSFMLVTFYYARKYDYPKGEKSSIRDIGISFRSTILALIMPITIIGGIVSGVATPTEVAVLAVVYALVLGGLINRKIKIKDLEKICLNTAKISAAIMIIVGTSNLLGWVLTYEDIPQKLTSFFLNFSANKLLIFLILDVLLIIAGMFLHGPAMIIVLAPIMLPIVVNLGMHPVQFGIIFTLAVAIGGVTPPVAACVFVVSSIGKIPAKDVLRSMILLMVVFIGCMLLVTYFPAISMYLPTKFYGAM